MDQSDDEPRRFASSPCQAHEIDPHYVGEAGSAQALVPWRKGERSRLRAERQALTVAERTAVGQALIAHLRAFLTERLGGARGQIFAGYWPIKGELDLRPLMTDLHSEGVELALPLVEIKASPLVFRRWTPETRMVRGDWGIPVPPPDAPVVTPGIVLAPLIGWTDDGYRLGYGGGYFDRTLADLSPRPFAIGVGLKSARLATIHPQPHDIPLDAIVTEAGVQVEAAHLA